MYPVVEECEGFSVCCVPATKGRLQKYTANFSSKALSGTPFRFTFEEAKKDGEEVMKQVENRLAQQLEAGRKATHVPEPQFGPSSTTDGSKQAPRKIQALSSWHDSRKQAQQAHKQQLSSAAVGRSSSSSSRDAGSHDAAAASPAGVLVPLALVPCAAAAAAGDGVAAAAAAAAGASLTGRFVRLLRCYHGGLPGTCVQLGSCTIAGSSADLYQGVVVPMNNNASTLQGYQCAAAAAAAAASSSKGDLHGVKVYHCSKPGTADNALHESVKQELRALQRLRFHPYAVQLCAEGELVTAACGDMQGATGSQSSQPHSDGSSSSSSSKRSKKPQNPGCAVLELCARSLQDVLLKRGHISESIAKPVAASLVQLLAYCQSGQLDCVIVHRNLKPANIFIRKNTSIAVANFGACHIVELLEVAGSAAGSSVAAGEDAADAAGAGRKRRHDEQQHPAAEPDPAVVAAAVAVRMHDGFVTPFYAAPDMYSVGAAAKPTDAAVSGSGDDDSSANTTAAPAALQHAGAQQGSSSNSRPGYDASVDVFALGVIVVEMLLGSLPSVFPAGPPRSAQQAQVWEQWLGNLVDGQVALPEGLQVSPAALQFIGCCCGVGRERGSSSAWRGKAHAASAAASSSMAAISDVLWFWMTSETL